MARRTKPHRIKWSPSQLPVWIVEPTSKKGFIKVTCPYRTCGNSFWVNKLKWLRGSTYMTRPCPHCFKTNQIPKPMIERYL